MKTQTAEFTTRLEHNNIIIDVDYGNRKLTFTRTDGHFPHVIHRYPNKDHEYFVKLVSDLATLPGVKCWHDTKQMVGV